MSASQRRGRTLSGQIRIRTARPNYVYTYTYATRASRPCARASKSETVSARTPLTNSRASRAPPCRAGEFLLRHRTAVTEPRLRPPSQHCQQQPRTCLPIRSTLHRRRGLWPHRNKRASSTHTRPNQPTNECTTNEFTTSLIATLLPRS